MSATTLLVRCPDCEEIVELCFTILTKDGKCFNIGACGNCHDHVTLKLKVEIDGNDFKRLWESGLPLFHYEQA